MSSQAGGSPRRVTVLFVGASHVWGKYTRHRSANWIKQVWARLRCASAVRAPLALTFVNAGVEGNAVINVRRRLPSEIAKVQARDPGGDVIVVLVSGTTDCLMKWWHERLCLRQLQYKVRWDGIPQTWFLDVKESFEEEYAAAMEAAVGLPAVRGLLCVNAPPLGEWFAADEEEARGEAGGEEARGEAGGEEARRMACRPNAIVAEFNAVVLRLVRRCHSGGPGKKKWVDHIDIFEALRALIHARRAEACAAPGGGGTGWGQLDLRARRRAAAFPDHWGHLAVACHIRQRLGESLDSICRSRCLFALPDKLHMGDEAESVLAKLVADALEEQLGRMYPAGSAEHAAPGATSQAGWAGGEAPEQAAAPAPPNPMFDSDGYLCTALTAPHPIAYRTSASVFAVLVAVMLAAAWMLQQDQEL